MHIRNGKTDASKFRGNDHEKVIYISTNERQDGDEILKERKKSN